MQHADSPGGPELPSVCQRDQAWKGATDQHSTTQISMASSGTDHFELNRNDYLLVVDSFLRYPKVVKVTLTTPASIIAVLKSIFARHGIPEIIS